MNKFNLNDLGKVLPISWRVQSFSKNKPVATCVAYIDARDVMNLLDEVVGPENWQCDYKEIKGNLFAGIAIKIEGEWVWKWDCGTESNTEKEKGEASDSFKRAAVKWKIGRFLYDLPMQYVAASEVKTGNNYPFPIDDAKKRIYDLTEYINSNIPQSKRGSNKKSNPERESEALKVLDSCKDLDDLRQARELYKDLEKSSAAYKKALVNKYEIFSSVNPVSGESIANEALESIGGNK